MPLSVKEHKRILIVPQETPNPFAFMMGGKNKKKPVEYLKEKLEAEGFEVTIYESMMDKILESPGGRSRKNDVKYVCRKSSDFLNHR